MAKITRYIPVKLSRMHKDMTKLR